MIKLPSLFSDGMVITKSAKIWGWGNPGEEVVLFFLHMCQRKKVFKTVCGADGRFEIILLSEDYGGPHTLTINEHVIKDVHIGRVWLCGGQSNMEGALSRAALLMPEEIKEDNRIRFFQVEKGFAFDAPKTNTNAVWRTAEGDLGSLFAVPYFFARQLLKDSDIPIGLVCTPAGGTPIEGWLPEKDPNYIKEPTEDANKKIAAWYEELTIKDKGFAENWAAPDYDDILWPSRMLLDSEGLPNHGSVWLRKKISLTKVEGSVRLNFGRFVNSVKVYVNGEQVTSVDYMYPPCTCTLPEGLLKTGENVIVIRIVGDGNNPQVIPGKEYALYLHRHSKFDLSGEWKWQTGAEMPKCPPGVWLYSNPGGVYNYMLAPVLGYSIDGILWYQGESNTGKPEGYSKLFTLLVKHMREKFGKNVPIIFNQLANHVSGAENFGENWARLREEQRQCLAIPNTAMSVSIDCGEWNDLHPLDKKTVGERMAWQARKLAYGENIVADGPIFKRAEVENGKLTVFFDNAVGLWVKNGYPLLEIIDDGGQKHLFYAVTKNDTLVADIGDIQAIIVRYGWCDNPAVVLYNAYNLPASPFESRVNINV